MKGLAGKVAIVTGGTGGIGKACAEVLAEHGARVFATDICVEADPFDTEMISFLSHDVSSETDWRHVIDTVLKEAGGLDILVNNAAVFHMKALLDTDADDMDAAYAVNQRGVFLGLRMAGAVMVEAGHGTIINIASAAGLRGYPTMFPYGTSKWQVRGMTKYAALDLAQRGVRINTVLPGVIDTPAHANNTPEAFEALRASVPMGKLGAPRDVANAVAFLASDDAGYITGAELSVCGGATI